MEYEMQNYLTQIAIQTKIDNYKEFKKTKEETIEAIMKNFDFVFDKAKQIVDSCWESQEKSICSGADQSYIEKRDQLQYEKEQKILEYDFALSVLDDAINGFSVESIARKNGISVEKIEEILEL